MRRMVAAGMIGLMAFLLIGATWNEALLGAARIRLEKALRDIGGCMRQVEDGTLKNHLGRVEDRIWMQFRIIHEIQKRLPELKKNPASPEDRKKWEGLIRDMRLELNIFLESIKLLEQEVILFCDQIRTKIPSLRKKTIGLAKRSRHGGGAFTFNFRFSKALRIFAGLFQVWD